VIKDVMGNQSVNLSSVYDITSGCVVWSSKYFQSRIFLKLLFGMQLSYISSNSFQDTRLGFPYDAGS